MVVICRPLLSNELYMPDGVTDLYSTTEITNVYSAATAAASVGVIMPL